VKTDGHIKLSSAYATIVLPVLCIYTRKITLANFRRSMHSLRSLGSRDREFDSHSGHGCLVFRVCVFLCLCTGRGLATS
jgi:hypothetical protein